MFAAVRTSHVCCCFVTVLPHSFFTYHSSPLAYYHLSPTAPLWIVSLIWFSHFLPFPFRGICCSHHTGCSPTLPRRRWWEVQIYPVCGTNASESVTIHRIQNWRNESLTNVFCCVCPIPMWTSCTLAIDLIGWKEVSWGFSCLDVAWFWVNLKSKLSDLVWVHSEGFHVPFEPGRKLALWQKYVHSLKTPICFWLDVSLTSKCKPDLSFPFCFSVLQGPFDSPKGKTCQKTFILLMLWTAKLCPPPGPPLFLSSIYHWSHSSGVSHESYLW